MKDQSGPGYRSRLLVILPLGAFAWFVVSAFCSVNAQEVREGQYGPQVESFLKYCRHEENELEFQIKRNEISRKEYLRSKNRIAVHREYVLRIVRENNSDVIPELHVVTVDEADALIVDGSRLLKLMRPGTSIEEKWLYIGKVTRGEVFFVVERLSKT
jgi:hypothetical protein